MAELTGLSPKDAEALGDFVQRLREFLGPRLVSLKLFGSKATGRDAPDSDIDVLIVVRDGTVEIEDQVLDIAFDVNLSHDVYVSPRVIDSNVFDDPVWKITPFIQSLEREGIPL